MAERMIEAGGATLAVSDDGGADSEVIPVVLLHGLTATKHYVVMGSRALQRSGHRVVSYDARGHGASSPALRPAEYRYEELYADLAAVLDALELHRVVLAGASMGAHTILRLALEQPERVAGLVVITPAYDPVGHEAAERLAVYDELSDALRAGDLEAFATIHDLARVGERWREAVGKVVRQRLAHHEHPLALADALRAVPRSRPFEDLHALEQIECPAVVVASRDDADPSHPLALGEAYAELLPDARLLVEEPGRSPLAWQGARLSKVIAGLAARAW